MEEEVEVVVEVMMMIGMLYNKNGMLCYFVEQGGRGTAGWTWTEQEE